MYRLLYNKEKKVYLFFHKDNLIETIQKVDDMMFCLDEWFGRDSWRAHNQKGSPIHETWEIKSVD